MAKKTKRTKKVEVEEPQVQSVVETPQVVEQPKPKKKPHPEDGWEIKNRT